MVWISHHALISHSETEKFHENLKQMCDRHDSTYYPKYKKWCDEYFFLKHRNEARGIGGIFFDYLNNDDFEKDFDFIHDVGSFFHKYVDQIITKNKDKNWTQEDRKRQLIKRGGMLNLIYYMIEVLNLDWRLVEIQKQS